MSHSDLHPIPLFKNKSGGKTVPGIIGSDDFNSGILNVFMTKLNTEPIIEVKSEELDICLVNKSVSDRLFNEH